MKYILKIMYWMEGNLVRYIIQKFPKAPFPLIKSLGIYYFHLYKELSLLFTGKSQWLLNYCLRYIKRIVTYWYERQLGLLINSFNLNFLFWVIVSLNIPSPLKKKFFFYFKVSFFWRSVNEICIKCFWLQLIFVLEINEK